MAAVLADQLVLNELFVTEDAAETTGGAGAVVTAMTAELFEVPFELVARNRYEYVVFAFRFKLTAYVVTLPTERLL